MKTPIEQDYTAEQMWKLWFALIRVQETLDSEIGICEQASRIMEFDLDAFECKQLLKDLMAEWPYFSGMRSFPISVTNEVGKMDQYAIVANGICWTWTDMTSSMKLEYKAMRRDLLQFCIDELEDMLMGDE